MRQVAGRSVALCSAVPWEACTARWLCYRRSTLAEWPPGVRRRQTREAECCVSSFELKFKEKVSLCITSFPGEAVSVLFMPDVCVFVGQKKEGGGGSYRGPQAPEEDEEEVGVTLCRSIG